MFYSPRLNEAVCGICREASGQVLEVSFDSKRLPYLGLWLCYGGWPSSGEEPLQYAVALEPTTSPCNNLANAQRTNTATSLKAGERYDWEILFTVREGRTLCNPISACTGIPVNRPSRRGRRNIASCCRTS